MDTAHPEPPVVPVAVSNRPEKPEVVEKGAEGHQPPAELDPPHESGYGFGV